MLIFSLLERYQTNILVMEVAELKANNEGWIMMITVSCGPPHITGMNHVTFINFPGYWYDENSWETLNNV